MIEPPAVPELQTPRLLLRRLVESDALGLHAAYGDAAAMRFWDGPPSRDVAETAARIRQSLEISPAMARRLRRAPARRRRVRRNGQLSPARPDASPARRRLDCRAAVVAARLGTRGDASLASALFRCSRCAPDRSPYRAGKRRVASSGRAARLSSRGLDARLPVRGRQAPDSISLRLAADRPGRREITLTARGILSDRARR